MNRVVDKLDSWIDAIYTASGTLVVTSAPGHAPNPPSKGTRAIILGVAIIVVTFVGGAMSLHWRTAFPLVVVGFAWGVLVSYLVMQSLRNHGSAQSWISGITGGISLDNVVKFLKHPDMTTISDLGAAINKLVTAIAEALGTDLSNLPYFRDGVIWGTWVALVTVAVIVIINVML